MSSVDIVVPCYNYAHYLPVAVESALKQRDVDVRVLIVDDKSPDETPEVAARLAAQDSRVSYVRNAENLGLVGTINVGVSTWASADYTLVLSADDAIAPGALARSASVLDAHPDTALVYGMAQIVGADAFQIAANDPQHATFQIISGERFLRCSCLSGNPLATPTALVRTCAQNAIGPYQRPAHTCDMSNWMRLATIGSVGVIKEVQGYYRWHGANMAARESGGLFNELKTRLATCAHVREEHGAGIAGFSELVSANGAALAAIRTGYAALRRHDLESYAQCVAFVEETAPEMRSSPQLLRLKMMRTIGWKLRNSPVGHWLSRVNERDLIEDWRDGHGELFGWWPAEQH